jgi:hypothetical protein
VLNEKLCDVFVVFGPSADGVPSGNSTMMVEFGGNSSSALNASHFFLLFSSLLAPSTMFLSVLFFAISASVSSRTFATCVPAGDVEPAPAHGSSAGGFFFSCGVGIGGLIV